MERVCVDVPGLCVVVESALGGVVDRLRAAWEPALLSGAAPTMSARGTKGAEQRLLRFWVSGDGTLRSEDGRERRSLDAGQIVTWLEGWMLEAIAAENSAALQLHAGAVTFADWLVVILGEPGAGKSTLTREALRLGAGYLSDDSLVCDAANIRGVARTLHFDAIRECDALALPEYLLDCDVGSNSFPDARGERWVVPLWRAPVPRVVSFTPRADRVLVVQLGSRAAFGFEPMSPLERAAALLGASLATGSSDFSVIPRGPSFRLTWEHEPARVLREILRAAKVETG